MLFVPFVEFHLYVCSNTFDSISCRPKVEGGYHVGLICTGFDPVDLVDPSKYKDFFYEVTGRKDIVFKGMSTPVLWKLVLPSLKPKTGHTSDHF